MKNKLENRNFLTENQLIGMAEYRGIKNDQENKSATSDFTHTKRNDSYQKIDLRPESAIQRKMQVMANKSSINKDIQAFQNLANSANSPIAQMQRIANTTPIQRKTNISHSTANFTYKTGATSTESETVGTSMTAYLDPKDPVSGSEPGASEQKNLMKRLKGKYGLASWALIKGHLLNHDLGGFGVASNLFPITKDANGGHLRAAEYGVKEHLKTANTNHDKGNNPNGVLYQVNVQSGLDENSYGNGSKFVCNAWDINNIDGSRTLGDKFIDGIEIESNPGTATNEDGWAHDDEDETADNFSHAQSPNTWNHKGKGRRGRVGSSDFEKEIGRGSINVT